MATYTFYKKSRIFLRNYGIGILLFLLVISPILIQKNDLYDDPFYSAYQGTIFSDNYEKLLSNISSENQNSASEYIENYGFLEFTNNAILLVALS